MGFSSRYRCAKHGKNFAEGIGGFSTGHMTAGTQAGEQAKKGRTQRYAATVILYRCDEAQYLLIYCGGGVYVGIVGGAGYPYEGEAGAL